MQGIRSIELQYMVQQIIYLARMSGNERLYANITDLAARAGAADQEVARLYTSFALTCQTDEPDKEVVKQYGQALSVYYPLEEEIREMFRSIMAALLEF